MRNNQGVRALCDQIRQTALNLFKKSFCDFCAFCGEPVWLTGRTRYRKRQDIRVAGTKICLATSFAKC